MTVLLIGAGALAACSGGSSGSSAGRATPPSPSPSSSGSASTQSATASSPPLAAASGAPSITPAAVRSLVVRDTALNNTANHQNSYSQLTQVDGGLELEQDRAYTRAGTVNGYRVPAFYSLGKAVAVPTTAGASTQYAVAQVVVGAKPASHGQLPGATAPQLSVYAKTPQGWRLTNAVGVAPATHLPAFAAPSSHGVTTAGSAAAVKAAGSRVLAVANGCVSQQSSPQVATPPSCGEISQARSVTGFHVAASIGTKRWPTYTVGLASGATLVIGAVDVSMRVRAAKGIAWQQGSIVTGLLGLTAKTRPAVRYGFAEQLVLSVALVVPASGGKASVLGVETGDLSAHQLGAPSSSGGGVSV